MLKKQIVFTDAEIVQAINEAVAKGATKDNVSDRLQPPNLLSFFNKLPRPERDRLLGLAHSKK